MNKLTLLFSLSLALLAACSQKEKGAVDAALISLNENDTLNWVENELSFYLDSIRVVVLAQTEDTSDCHMCGPDAALVLLERTKVGAAWEVKKIKKHIPVISQWGKLPKFELVRLKDRNVLLSEFGFGNQGNFQSNIVLFDLDYCDFGEPAFRYAYQSRIESYMDEQSAQSYSKHLPQINTSWPFTYDLDMIFQFDAETEDLTITSRNRELKFIHPKDDRQTWIVKLPLITEHFRPMLCTWGNSNTTLNDF
ncbi:MAG: hypothetical protein FJX80_04305 [Bacteroidetes bacterium]|nr:hypothetical protein [Bacteroidota bacterium]